MNRLTDNRLGNGWYQPKDKQERKELQNLGDVSYEELYKALREYENLGLSPEEIRDFIENTRKDVDRLMSYQTFYAKLKEKGLINEEQDIERVCAALEKQIPKKIVTKGHFEFCPNCKTELTHLDYYYVKTHCCECGQKLLWEGDSE